MYKRGTTFQLQNSFVSRRFTNVHRPSSLQLDWKMVASFLTPIITPLDCLFSLGFERFPSRM